MNMWDFLYITRQVDIICRWKPRSFHLVPLIQMLYLQHLQYPPGISYMCPHLHPLLKIWEWRKTCFNNRIFVAALLWQEVQARIFKKKLPSFLREQEVEASSLFLGHLWSFFWMSDHLFQLVKLSVRLEEI